jgi:hypothetical protein
MDIDKAAWITVPRALESALSWELPVAWVPLCACTGGYIGGPRYPASRNRDYCMPCGHLAAAPAGKHNERVLQCTLSTVLIGWRACA